MCLYLKESIDGDSFTDSQLVFISCLLDIPSDIGTHLFPKAVGLVDPCQQIGIASGLLIACPIEGEPIRNGIMEILQEDPIGY